MPTISPCCCLWDSTRCATWGKNTSNLNKTYQADVAILADARLALRDLIAAVRERLGSRSGGVKPEVAAEIQRARTKWLGEWRPSLHRYCSANERLSRHLRPDAGDRSRQNHCDPRCRRQPGLLSPFWVATKPLTYIGMGGMAAMGWSMGAAIGAKLGRPDHLVVHLLGDASFGMTGMEVGDGGPDAGCPPSPS